MIDNYLWADKYLKNPKYRCAGDMRLYCLNRIKNLENISEIAFKIEKNLSLRWQRRVRQKTKILIESIAIVEAIGNYYVAIAILTKIVQALLLETYQVSKFGFKAIKEEAIIKLKDFRISSFQLYEPLNNFAHWYNISGYKLCIIGEGELSYSVQGNLEKYCFSLQDRHCPRDLSLVKKITGWQNISQVVIGLEQLINFGGGNINDEINWGLVNQFSSPGYPEPPTKETLLLLDLIQSSNEMKRGFNKKIEELKHFQKTGCPVKMNCKQMGLKSGICDNYSECKKSLDRHPDVFS